MKSKPELRLAFRSRLKSGAEAESALDSGRAVEALNSRLVRFLSEQSGCWAGFQPTGFEPDIRPTIKRLEDIDWVYPRVEGEHIVFYRPHAPTVFTLNKWGILEPEPSRADRVNKSELDGLLIPGLALDKKCNRLGRGGGYYDRALAEIESINSKAIKIGVALDLQISDEEFPVERFDMPMDWVVTESRALGRSMALQELQSGVLPERKTS